MATATENKEQELTFEDPGPHPNRKTKNLFTVKAFSPQGSLVQLPVADQINNNVSSPETMVGLRFYENMGFKVLWDYEANKGAYCPAADCWAKWNDEHQGYCCPEHKMPVRENPSLFSQGVTTTRSAWKAPR